MTIRLGVRWTWATASTLAGVVAIGLLATQMLYGRVGALGGASLVIQGNKSQFNTAQLSTTNVAFAMVPITTKAVGTDTTATRYALRFGFASGSLNGFCFSQTRSFLSKSWTIRVSSRDATSSFDVTGKNIQFDVTSARATGSGIQLKGNTALPIASQAVTTWSSGGATNPSYGTYGAGSKDSVGAMAEGFVVNPLEAPNSFAGINGRLAGVDSSAADLYNVTGDIYDAIIEGPVDVKNLRVEVVAGDAATEGCKNIAIVQ